MQVVFLCGGFGTRLGNITKDIPKPLVPIGDTNSLELLVKYFAKHGHRKMLFCTGHKNEMVSARFANGEKYGVEISYSNELQPLGSGGSLKNAEKLLEENFWVVNADDIGNYSLEEMEAFHKKGNQLATIHTHRIKEKRSGHLEIKNGFITKFDFDGTTIQPEFAMSGASILKKEVLKHIPLELKSLEKDIFPKLIEEKKIKAFIEAKPNLYWIDIGLPTTLEKARNDLASGTLEKAMENC